jgi:tetratricopeptide (TPR) repeat protein
LVNRRSRIASACLGLFLVVLLFCPSGGADRKSDKDKKKEDKKEKDEPWVEVSNSHFIVASDGGEKTARHVAAQFEQVRRVLEATMPNARLDLGFPIRILAARNPQTFAKLFPEFPVEKRREQPVGLFVSGETINYIGLRANVSGPAPYEEIYQSYAKVILRRSYRTLPPWLEEGFFNVYGSIITSDNGARLGRTDPEDLSVLWESPLLPLDLVFHVDRSSPYYSSAEKNTVYYAESRAMVHFLLTDPQMSSAKVLGQYMAAVEKGTDALQAAKQIFGDLNQLQSRLEAYIKQSTSSPPSEILASGGEAPGGSRTLSPAEAEARMGDFSASRGKLDDAQEKLEGAVKLDSSLADAEQSLGYLALRQNNLDDCEKHFERALQLAPGNALTYYGQGLVALTRAGFVGVPVDAIQPLEKTVALNPNFAPAWFTLAKIYALRPETLQNALADAKHAVALAPGEQGYQIQLASITERLAHPELDRKSSVEAMNSSSGPRTGNREQPGQIAVTKAPPPPSSAAAASDSAPRPSSDRSLHIERKTEPDDKPTTTAAARTREEPPAPPPPPVVNTGSHVYSMVGTISEVNCSDTPQIRVTLKAQTLTMHLHAADFAQLSIKPAGSTAPVKVSCTALRGRNVRVSYFLVAGKEWDGEMQAVEFRKEP